MKIIWSVKNSNFALISFKVPWKKSNITWVTEPCTYFHSMSVVMCSNFRGHFGMAVNAHQKIWVPDSLYYSITFPSWLVLHISYNWKLWSLFFHLQPSATSIAIPVAKIHSESLTWRCLWEVQTSNLGTESSMRAACDPRPAVFGLCW